MRAIEIDDSSEMEEEKLWMDSISKNPAFDFLKEPEEDIYSQKDGEPLDIAIARLEDYDKNPDKAMDFDTAMDEIEAGF